MTKDSKNLVTLIARKPLLWLSCSDVQSSGRKSLYAEAEAKALLPATSNRLVYSNRAKEEEEEEEGKHLSLPSRVYP